jgi:2-dehydropantoate 2-reductase
MGVIVSPQQQRKPVASRRPLRVRRSIVGSRRLQASPTYLIVGAGKVARHFCRYFKLLKIPCLHWARRNGVASRLPRCHTGPAALRSLLKQASHVLLLIDDAAIESFVRRHRSAFKSKTLIHFSGSLVTKFAYGAHPLMTFGDRLYTLKEYQSLVFVLDDAAPPLRQLFPKLKNKSFVIPQALKPFYHALCVLSGNFTVLLWQKFFLELERKLQITQGAAKPYLRQICANLLRYAGGKAESVLTGPLARKDWRTVAANLRALAAARDPYYKIYKAFAGLYGK